MPPLQAPRPAAPLPRAPLTPAHPSRRHVCAECRAQPIGAAFAAQPPQLRDAGRAQHVPHAGAHPHISRKAAFVPLADEATGLATRDVWPANAPHRTNRSGDRQLKPDWHENPATDPPLDMKGVQEWLEHARSPAATQSLLARRHALQQIQHLRPAEVHDRWLNIVAEMATLVPRRLHRTRDQLGFLADLAHAVRAHPRINRQHPDLQRTVSDLLTAAAQGYEARSSAVYTARLCWLQQEFGVRCDAFWRCVASGDGAAWPAATSGAALLQICMAAGSLTVDAGLPPPAAALTRLLGIMRAQRAAMPPIPLSRSLQGLAMTRLTALQRAELEAWLTESVAAVVGLQVDRQHPENRHALVNTLAAYHCLRALPPPPEARALLRHLERAATGLQPKQLAAALFALAVLGLQPHASLRDALATAVRQVVPHTRPATAAALCKSLTTLKIRVGDRAAERLFVLSAAAVPPCTLDQASGWLMRWNILEVPEGKTVPAAVSAAIERDAPALDAEAIKRVMRPIALRKFHISEAAQQALQVRRHA